MDDTCELSVLKNWIETRNRGVAFYSPLKHGLLTGKYTQPVLHRLVDALLMDTPIECVFLGQRNVLQMETTATLGNTLSPAEAEWVKKLHR